MMAFPSYVDVAVSLPVYRTYTYGVPDRLEAGATAGSRVLVPFGSRRVTGFILDRGDDPGGVELKPILDILDDRPLFPAGMIPFFRWTADYYLHPIGEVIRTALPAGLTIADRLEIRLTESGRRALNNRQATGAEKALMNRLLEAPRPVRRLMQENESDQTSRHLKAIERRGWISRHHRLSGGQTRHRTERFVTLAEDFSEPKRFSAQRRTIVSMLRESGETAASELRRHVPTAAALVRAMARQEQVILTEKPVFRDPFGDPIPADTAPTLNAEQEAAVAALTDRLSGGFETFLLTGVTGSGKTEVYLRAAAEAMHRGIAVLVLVPEIVLISQMERRFRARFGDSVAVLHSGLSAGEKFDQWIRIRNGDAPIAIGARSAIFAPLERIGMIVVDEEHDNSYKQETGLRYNARDLAVVRARQHGALAVLGSATPSIQSYFNVRTGKYTEISLPRRVEERRLPDIDVVDLRETRDMRGARRFLSPPLIRAMTETLERGEQVLLFLNRRGFASYPVCGSCGETIRCRNCDISLTLHRQTNAFRCHYCGHTKPFRLECPSCGQSRMRLLGMGTEKVEEAVRQLFPEARVARMDRDTTTRKGAIVRLLKGLRTGTTDVLVGTQMVAKGHDFPNITLVGVICADLSLNFPDFRAGERTFQLLAQVAGRAGRGDAPGRVVLQTYNPDHFSIQAAREQDFRAFYRHDIAFRESLGYPPFTRMVQIRISGRRPDETADCARDLGERFRSSLRSESFRSGGITVLGPIEAPLSRIANRHRWQILLKGRRSSALRSLAVNILFDSSHRPNRNVSVVADVDPMMML